MFIYLDARLGSAHVRFKNKKHITHLCLSPVTQSKAAVHLCLWQPLLSHREEPNPLQTRSPEPLAALRGQSIMENEHLSPFADLKEFRMWQDLSIGSFMS